MQWGSRLHPHVSLLSTELEYTTVSKVGCKMMWMRYLLGKFRYNISHPLPILVGNVSATQVAKHLEHQLTMKYVHHTYHWICNHVECGDISVTHVPGSELPPPFIHPCEQVSPPDHSGREVIFELVGPNGAAVGVSKWPDTTIQSESGILHTVRSSKTAKAARSLKPTPSTTKRQAQPQRSSSQQ